MSRRILRHRKLPDGSYYLLVHLDDSKTTDVTNTKGEVVGSEADPAYLREFSFRPLEAPTPQTDKDGELKLDDAGNPVVKVQKLHPTEQAYLDAQIEEVALILDAEAESAGKKLGTEGQAF